MAHGSPCWYELTTRDIAASQAFYGPMLGWAFQDAGMEGFDYTLAMAGETMIAGLYAPFEGQPEAWLIYFEAEDLDATLARAVALGAQVLQPTNDVPETGRFAVLADPQGAAFGLFHPLPGQPSGAFAMAQPGHGCWHELSSGDPAASLAFYAEVLSWRASNVLEMGDLGAYHLFADETGEIGGIMRGEGADAAPEWTAHFSVPSAAAAAAQITASGGTVTLGPVEVPDGAFAVMAKDPQGAHFGLVGGA